MTTFTRETLPAVPVGKVRLCEYGQLDRSLLADRTLIASAVGALHGYPTVTLQHISRGYVPAGSCARWDESCWSVTYTVADGAIHGKRFLEDNEPAAREYFAKLTDTEAVTRRRQEDAMLEETVYRPAREQRAIELAARNAAEKARKAAMRKARKNRY